MARKATKSRKAVKANKATPKRKRETRLFAVKLRDIPLSKAQAHRIASQIRDVTTKELMRMDFRIDELKAPARGTIATAGCQGCGGCSCK